MSGSQQANIQFNPGMFHLKLLQIKHTLRVISIDMENINIIFQFLFSTHKTNKLSAQWGNLFEIWYQKQ